ncbi:MAG: hypothetical protein RMK18_04265 [Armatimonadota bacterium]|nr:hypothetical protein [Armatimonadota bacterium]MCX7777395.1 hypothetical protein [Armatimonadota bacterium]MDW8025064.1 hypothetical protein [Armatimonadota bacterium]
MTSWIAALGLVIAISVSMAQPPGRPQAGGPPGLQQFSPEEWSSKILDFWAKQLNLTLTNEQRKAIQDAMKERVDAFMKFGEARRSLVGTLRAGATDAQIKTAVEDYGKAVKDYEKRLEEIEEQLNAKLNYKANPKLHALLIVVGAVGRYGGMFGWRWGAAGGRQPGAQPPGAGQRQQGRFRGRQ